MGFTFEMTEDVALIKSALAHPAIYYKLLHDDYSPKREDWEPLMGCPQVQYIAVRKNGELIGCFMASLLSAISVEMHSAFLPSAWGRDVRPAAKAGIEWLWKTYPTIHRIIGRILASNVASLRYAESLGFKQWGVDEKSFMRGGVLHDQVCVGMSRPEDV
jgi:RimJ/RimL family protein N-acetyltransferase